MKKLVAGAIVVGGMVGMSGTALAGQQISMAVEVNASNSYARGIMGDARASTDTQQMIGCYIAASVGYSYVVCEARNASGVFKSCTTSDPHLMLAAQSIGPASYIAFFWDSAGNCVHLNVTNSSLIKPMSP